ncbi:MAG: transketolase [Alphaproteobacteria bacterium]
MTTDNHHNLARMANAIRFLAMDGVQKANSGHPGMPMGMADVAATLFNDFLTLDPAHPSWPNRDRFVLSAGHGSMLHYALNYLLGYQDMTKAQLENFRQLGSITAGHPERGHALGVETTTGPLGQGLANAVGMAIGEAMTRAKYGKNLCDHYCYVIAGDGCLQEGISHEAIDLAGHLKLKKLIVLWDDNQISIDGTTDLSTSMNQLMRFKAAGFDVQAIDGHDHHQIRDAISKAQRSSKPSLIACKTKIGYGAPTLEGTAKTHGAPLGAAEIAAARQALGWDYPPFEIPDDILDAWRKPAMRGAAAHKAWHERLDHSSRKKSFKQFLDNDLHSKTAAALNKFKQQHQAENTKVATRKASQMVLEVLNDLNPNLIGGSADLTGSNLTKTSQGSALTKANFKGNYIHYGIREHAMAGMMNGIALYGGYRPYGGTFLVFSDYARGAMRLSALMGLQVIYVMTHDSIGLGEDGPTHQPVEHLAIARATPNLFLYRPCDIIETAEAWEDALSLEKTPSILALSRQNLPLLRDQASSQNKVSKGAYVLKDTAGKPRDLTLIASGSEVEIALDAAQRLAQDHNLHAAIISMPCQERFEQQDQAYRQQILGDAPRIAIEAACGFGWERYIGENGAFIGMNGFGASAPIEDLYTHFGITAEAIIEKARSMIAPR